MRRPESDSGTRPLRCPTIRLIGNRIRPPRPVLRPQPANMREPSGRFDFKPTSIAQGAVTHCGKIIDQRDLWVRCGPMNGI